MSDLKRDWFADPPPRRLGALALITRGDEEFLIIRRGYWQAVSEWGLPGGSAEADELPRRALSRCLAEKLGLRVTAERFLAVDVATVRPGRSCEGINFVFHIPLTADPDAGLDACPAPADGSGYVEARWVTAESVANLAIDHELFRIEQCLYALRDNRAVDLVNGVPTHTSRTRPAA